MRSFLSQHADTIALAGGALLSVLLIVAYAYGVTDLTAELDRTLDPDQSAGQPVTFDLEAASRLDLKGLSPER